MITLTVTTSSSTGFDESVGPEVDTLSSINAPVVFVIVVVIIFVVEFGNLMTIVAFFVNRRLRRPRYIPVVSMAISDLLFGVLAILFLVERKTIVPNKRLFTLSLIILCNLLADASAFHLVVLAIDRFVAVCHPMSYRRVMTSRCIIKMTIACWLISVAIGCPYLMWVFVRADSITDVTTTCYCYDPGHGPVPLLFDFAIQFSTYLLISTTLIVLSLGVLMAARRTGSQLNSRDQCDMARRQSNGVQRTRSIGSRAYTMVTVIIVAFIINWAPYFVVQILSVASLTICRAAGTRIAHMVSLEFGTLNAGVNFIVYALVNRNFRYAYKSTLRKLLSCGRGRSTTTIRTRAALRNGHHGAMGTCPDLEADLNLFEIL